MQSRPSKVRYRSWLSTRTARIITAASINFVSNTVLIPTAVGAPVAGQSPKLNYLKPVGVSVIQNEKDKSQSVTMTYDEGCGESLRGVLIDETKHGLYVGAVLDRSDTMCLTLPVKKTITLKTTGQRPVKTLNLGEAERISLSEVTDVTISSTGMAVSWQDTCRPYVGVVLSPSSASDGSPKMSLMIANLPKDGLAQAGVKTCPRATVRKQISGVNLTADKVQVTPKQGRLENLFTLRIVASKKLAVNQDRSLSITWNRTCRDVPVAALFAGNDGTKVAMISAFVPNAPCSFKGTKEETFTVADLLISPTQTLNAMTAEEVYSLSSSVDSTLSLQSITGMKVARMGRGDWLMAATETGCGDRLGIAIGQDSVGNAAMAYLAAGNQKVCHVSRINTAQTLTAPLVAPAQGPIPKVFSLKVFGTSIN